MTELSGRELVNPATKHKHTWNKVIIAHNGEIGHVKVMLMVGGRHVVLSLCDVAHWRTVISAMWCRRVTRIVALRRPLDVAMTH